MLAEKDAGRPPVRQPSGVMFVALGRVQHSSKASGATPAGALMCPHEGNFTHSRIKIPCRGGAHPYTFGRPRREGEGETSLIFVNKDYKGLPA